MEVKEWPFVSVVIPALNEGEYIRDCLSSVLAIDYPQGRFEVLVVDNGSTDLTVDIAKQFPIKVISQPGVKVGAVRNFGVSQSRGEILAFVDADCVVPRGWLQSGVSKLLSDDNIGAVGGSCLLREHPCWVERYWIIDSHPEHGDSHSLNGANIITRKEVFVAIGQFDETMNAGEDTDFARNLLSAGYEVVKESSVAIIHLGYPRSLNVFFRRQIWQSSSNASISLVLARDKVLMLTMLYVALAVFGATIGFFNFLLGAASLLALVVLPALLTLKRLSRSGFPRLGAIGLTKAYVLDTAYLVGRSVGLLVSLLDTLGIDRNKKRYY